MKIKNGLRGFAMAVVFQLGMMAGSAQTNIITVTLQFTTNLVSPAIWNTNLLAPVVVNGQNALANPITGFQMFFRLTQ